jgi:hypothetical protein
MDEVPILNPFKARRSRIAYLMRSERHNPDTLKTREKVVDNRSQNLVPPK